MAQKIEFDNFPVLPDYEGIQSKFLNDDNSDNIKYNKNKAEPLNTSMLSESPSPFKITNMGKVRDSTSSLANGTVNTLNSINLEKINQRNENRLLSMDKDFKFNDDDDDLPRLDHSLIKGSRQNNDDYGNFAIKLDTNTNFMKNDKLGSIREENWEETFKK